jgi:hypothetical protein
MKHLLVLSGFAMAFLIAGCAPAPLTKADIDGKIVCHADQMDQVERAARRDHKTVQWVNCPQAVLRAS